MARKPRSQKQPVPSTSEENRAEITAATEKAETEQRDQNAAEAAATSDTVRNEPEAPPAEQMAILFVRTKRRVQRRRRAGFVFGRDGYGVELAALTDEQVAAIRNDPALIVEEGSVDAPTADETE